MPFTTNKWRPNRKASNSHCTRIKHKLSNVAYKVCMIWLLPTSTVEVLIIQLVKINMWWSNSFPPKKNVNYKSHETFLHCFFYSNTVQYILSPLQPYSIFQLEKINIFALKMRSRFLTIERRRLEDTLWCWNGIGL